MTKKRDPYDILGVSRDASLDEIKKAYRKLARKYHPDANPGDKTAEDKFKEIAEAYSILGDADQRAAYDRFGYAGLEGMGPGADPFTEFGFGDLFARFFSDFFGGTRSWSTVRREVTGRSIRITLPISFEEAAKGVDKEVELKRRELCSTCNGSRAAAGTSPRRCPTCGGTGRERRQQRTPFGIMINETTCRSCGGDGEIVDNPCKTCNGTGMVLKPRKIKVKIPAGIDTGHRLRVSGEGEPGLKGAPPGDLYADIRLKEHKYFEREGSELIYEAKINIAQAALGDEILVPTLKRNEKAKLKIPPGTQVGTVFRLKGKGFPRIGGFGRGDMHIFVRVVTPEKLSPREKELFTELKELWRKKEEKKSRDASKSKGKGKK